MCLLDEYSSQETCQERADSCYHTYRREKCVANIRECLSQHTSQPGECLGVAESCLYEGKEALHQQCLDQIPLCLPRNTEVSPQSSHTARGIWVICIIQDYSLLSMEACFEHIDECLDQKLHKEKCLEESRDCFSLHHYGFDYCFKMLTDCVGQNGDGHLHEGEEGHYEEEEEYCTCSCHMDKCFDLRDKTACSDMFDICFHVEEEDDEEDYHYHDEGPEGCIERVRECLYSSDDRDHCLQLMSSCLTGEAHSPEQHCSNDVIQCVTDNKYNIAHCYDLITSCSDSTDSAKASTDCYTHIELCYRTSSSQTEHVCTALIPTCYRHTEQQPSDSCYSKARSCLLNNYISNTVCHQQLSTCLNEEGEYEHEQIYYGKALCKENLKGCLSTSHHSSSSCYDDLQQYLAGGDCHVSHQ